MGSPEFAAQSLERLLKDGFRVSAVITGPDRQKGRGLKVTESTVKTSAKNHNIPVFQPENLKDTNFLEEMKSFEFDLGIVVAFRMLPEVLWSMPKLGTINLHASLLPNYRGAAPINWAIMNGEEKTGLTTFFLKHKIDTGDVILQEEVEIGPEMNAGELHDLLMEKGGRILSESVKKIQDGQTVLINQESLKKNFSTLHPAPKIFKQDAQINWKTPVKEIHNHIRGLSPHPGAWGKFLTKSGKEVIFKVYKSEVTDLPSAGKSKEVNLKETAGFIVGTEDFYLKILEIQVEGKQKMPVDEFLRGFALDDVKII